MERKEVGKIMDKIRAFRQSFLVTDNTFNEWCKILEPYRYEDVDKKLDEYFRDSSNFGQYPDAYYLTKYLKTEEQLSQTQEINAKCSLCGKEMPYNELEEHYDRCSSIDYVYRESRKYLHKTFDKQKLWEMDNEIKGKIIGCVKTNDGTEYAFFDDGSICEIIAPGQYKKVNDIIDKNDFESKGKNTPFDGYKLFGKVKYTILDGEIVYND